MTGTANAWDVSGKTVVITGGNSGIGFETAVALAEMGADVLITVRDAGKGTAAVDGIRRRVASAKVDFVVFDLGSLSSVRAGATEILDRCPRIDVLINNAGLVLSERQVTADGYEATFAINHLGPFLLTELLLDRIKASAPARIINVASDAHTQARRGLDFDDLQAEHGYRGFAVYSKSKLANIYFTTELARRLAGTGVTVNSLHPGTVATGYGRDGDTTGILAFGLRLIKPFVLTAAQGARTSIYLASSPELGDVTGQYFVKCKVARPSSAARDDSSARRLWDASEKLVASGT